MEGEKKLKPVNVLKHETCRTYALKRIGLEGLLSLENDKPSMESLPFSDKFKQIKEPVKGALLLWTEKGVFSHNAGGSIDEFGRVCFIEKKVYGHLGVYEGGGFYSDVVNGRYFPELNFGKLEDVAKPDYILEYLGGE